MPILAKLILWDDEEILIDTCWALSYLSDGSNERIQAVIYSGVCQRLVELLRHPSSSVQIPALRSVGNIVTGDDHQTQIILDCNGLDALQHLLASPKETIRKEACWTLSNITAGTPAQIQAVIDHGLMRPLIHILTRGDFKTRKEACWAICNATSGGVSQPEQVKYLVSEGCIKPLCDILNFRDNKIILVALDGLDNILSVGELAKTETPDGLNPFAIMVEECGGIEIIHDLQGHDNAEIYQKSYTIIDKYFSDDADEDEEGLMADDQFSFQTHVQAPQGGFQFWDDILTNLSYPTFYIHY